MSETLFPASPVDLEALDQFLMSDASPESLERRAEPTPSDEEKHAANSERYCCARSSSRAKDLLPEQIHVVLVLVVHPSLRRLEKKRPRIRSLWPRS